jgi:predicted esterase
MMTRTIDSTVLRAGADLSAARLAIVMVHGRGGSATDMLGLAEAIQIDDLAYLAPQAPQSTWYPYSFLAPIPQNEPSLTGGLHAIDGLVGALADAGIPRERVAILGFSQGACLGLEYAARHAARYAALIGLSGGLIGPPGTPRDYPGTFDGTPVFLGCSDVDAHIPLERVHESAEVFRRMGAVVDERIYPGMGHTVTADEIDKVRKLLIL